MWDIQVTSVLSGGGQRVGSRLVHQAAFEAVDAGQTQQSHEEGDLVALSTATRMLAKGQETSSVFVTVSSSTILHRGDDYLALLMTLPVHLRSRLNLEVGLDFSEPVPSKVLNFVRVATSQGWANLCFLINSWNCEHLEQTLGLVKPRAGMISGSFLQAASAFQLRHLVEDIAAQLRENQAEVCLESGGDTGIEWEQICAPDLVFCASGGQRIEPACHVLAQNLGLAGAFAERRHSRGRRIAA
jgi:hypothetical protein